MSIPQQQQQRNIRVYLQSCEHIGATWLWITEAAWVKEQSHQRVKGLPIQSAPCFEERIKTRACRLGLAVWSVITGVKSSTSVCWKIFLALQLFLLLYKKCLPRLPRLTCFILDSSSKPLGLERAVRCLTMCLQASDFPEPLSPLERQKRIKFQTYELRIVLWRELLQLTLQTTGPISLI